MKRYTTWLLFLSLLVFLAACTRTEAPADEFVLTADDASYRLDSSADAIVLSGLFEQEVDPETAQILRLSTSSDKVETARGIRVGDTRAAVLDAYELPDESAEPILRFDLGDAEPLSPRLIFELDSEGLVSAIVLERRDLPAEEPPVPADPPADIEWVDPVVKYAVYAAFIGRDARTQFDNAHPDAAAALWDGTNAASAFDAYTALFEQYLRDNDIRVTQPFLNNIRSILLYSYADNSCTAEFTYYDASLSADHAREAAVGFPLDVRIQSLADFAHMSGLAHLELRYCDASDLTPLTELDKLEFLMLDNGNLTDWTPLLRCPSLNSLWIDGAKIQDLSFLSAFDSLSVLGLERADSPELSFLKGMTGLTELRIYESTDLDLAKLAEHCPPGLTTLTLSACGITDISPLAGLTGLTALDLSRNELPEISALSGMTHLRTLNVEGNRITDFSPAEKLPALTELRRDTAPGA